MILNSLMRYFKSPVDIYSTFVRTAYGMHPPEYIKYHYFNVKKPGKPLKRRLQGRIPFDKRFEVSGRHVSQRVEGGNSQIANDIALHRVQRTGYIDPDTNRFVKVEEMIPEFIVPDLTGFQLKPYVSYRVPDITQSELTPKQLFDSVYAERIGDAMKEGEISDERLRTILYRDDVRPNVEKIDDKRKPGA